jgi:hypothetical protein
MPSKVSRQSEAIKYIQLILKQRGLSIEPGIYLVGEDPWQVFEHRNRVIGVDTNSGLWVGPSGGKWKCLSSSCTVSSAAEAVEFLIKG